MSVVAFNTSHRWEIKSTYLPSRDASLPKQMALRDGYALPFHNKYLDTLFRMLVDKKNANDFLCSIFFSKSLLYRFDCSFSHFHLDALGRYYYPPVLISCLYKTHLDSVSRSYRQQTKAETFFTNKELFGKMRFVA